MPRQTLYSLRTHVSELNPDLAYYITKFADGEVESAYALNEINCECPAGARPSCRHRQMLPQMLAAGLVNTHWFWDFDLGRAVDFEGQLKSNLDALQELAEGNGQGEPEPVPEPALDPPHKSLTHIPLPLANWRRF